MKTARAALFFSIIGQVSSAWAAVDGFEDHSGIFSWIFLGFCALIVVAQVLPAIMMMAGMAKGVKGSAEAVEDRAAK